MLFVLYQVHKGELIDVIESIQAELGETLWEAAPELAADACEKVANLKEEEVDLSEAELDIMEQAQLEQQQLQEEGKCPAA